MSIAKPWERIEATAAKAAVVGLDSKKRTGSDRIACDGRPWPRTCSMQARPRLTHLDI